MTWRILSALLALAFLAGCSHDRNRGAGLADPVKIDTLSPSTPTLYPRVIPATGIDPAAPRSLVGIDRSNWIETRVLVPVEPIEHAPHYTREEPKYAVSHARQRGEYPTVASALDGTRGQDRREQIVEALVSPLQAGWEMVMFVPRLFVAPPWEPVASPVKGYERRPRDGAARRARVTGPAEAAP